jgi:hypothetical protein
MTNGMTVRLPTVRSIPAQSKRLAKSVDALNALASTAAHAGEGADDQVTLDRKAQRWSSRDDVQWSVWSTLQMVVFSRAGFD